MPTRTYQIPMGTLFSKQANSDTNYGNMDLESQRIKEEEQRRAEIARENLLGIANTPMSLSNIDTFTPAEMVQSEFPIPNAEPYSQLTARQAPSSIVGGMFSPEISRAAQMEYMQRRQAAMQNEAMAFAQLSPMQQAQFGFYRGGQQLGDALGSALGGQDPQLQRISFRNSIAQQLDMRDPESYFKAATVANQAGDREFANSLVEAGTKIESTMSQVQLRKAQAKKAENYQQAQTDSAQKRASIASLEEKLATDPTYKPSAKELANARFILASESKTRTQIDPLTNQLYIINGLDVNEAAPNLAKYLKSEGIVAPESTTTPAPAETTQPSTAQTPPVATTTPTQPQPVVIAKGVTAVPTPASKQKAEELAKKQKVEEEEKTRAVESFEDQISAIQSLRETINTTKGLISPTTTGYGSFLSLLPATDARTLEGNTQTIKNNVALSKLRELKQQSSTGASGLGALNMKEFDAIQGIIASLDPKSKNYASDLNKVDAFFSRAEELMQKQSVRAKENLGAGVDNEAKIKRFIDFNGGKPTRQQAINALKKSGAIK